MAHIVLVMAATLLTQEPAGRPTTGQADLLRAVAGLYDANRAKFPFGSAEFDYLDAYAKDFNSAARGELSDSYSAQCTFAFDGKDAAYTKLHRLEDMAATDVKTSANQGYSRLDSFRVLTNGEETFIERIGAAGGNTGALRGHVITPGTDDFFRSAEFPLDLGRPDSLRDDLAQNIRSVLQDKSGAALDSIQEDVVLDGVKTVKIALSFPNGIRTYWVDLQRGAIPIKVHDAVKGGDTIDRHFGDIRSVAARGWVPHSTTIFLRNGRVKRLVIKQADFDHHPAPETFKMVLTQPRAIANVGKGVAYISQKAVDLNNLPKPFSRQSVPLGSGPTPGLEPSLPGERAARRPYLLMTAIAISVVAAGSVVWRKVRR